MPSSLIWWGLLCLWNTSIPATTAMILTGRSDLSKLMKYNAPEVDMLKKAVAKL